MAYENDVIMAYRACENTAGLYQACIIHALGPLSLVTSATNCLLNPSSEMGLEKSLAKVRNATIELLSNNGLDFASAPWKESFFAKYTWHLSEVMDTQLVLHRRALNVYFKYCIDALLQNHAVGYNILYIQQNIFITSYAHNHGPIATYNIMWLNGLYIENTKGKRATNRIFLLVTVTNTGY